MTTAPATCPDCQHEQHGTNHECEQPVHHGPSRWHRCLCLAREGANRPCPPQMDCQGGLFGYADIWHLQQGRSIRGLAFGPDVLHTPTAQPVTPSECRAQLIGEISVQLEERLRAAGHVAAADDIVGICLDLAREVAPTP